MQSSEAVRRQYLDAMGITQWEQRTAVAPAVGVTPATASPDWTALAEAVRACTKCALHGTRTQTVFGVGNRKAQWMFVGEAPGADEDRQGEPFVGAAGKLLNAMLAALGLKREEVFIANVLKCRPPNNRDPQADEVEQCEPYLIRQIELIQPKLIVALGRHAAHSLLKTDLALARLRGQSLSYQNIPLVVTYHPAYLLRTPSDKRKAWEDLCRAHHHFANLDAMSAVLSDTLPHLRDMQEADVPAVMAIERVAYEFPWTEGILRDCFRYGYICKVYESGEGIIGYGIISIGAGECHFLNICIAPPHQQHGHGARLVAHLLQVARQARARTALLEVRASNTAAFRLYDKLGFNEIGVRKGYYPARGGREDALVLAREL